MINIILITFISAPGSSLLKRPPESLDSHTATKRSKQDDNKLNLLAMKLMETTRLCKGNTTKKYVS